MEADLASKEQLLLDEVERHPTSPTRRGSRVEVAAAYFWYVAKLALGHEPSGSSGRRKKKKRRRK